MNNNIVKSTTKHIKDNIKAYVYDNDFTKVSMTYNFTFVNNVSSTDTSFEVYCDMFDSSVDIQFLKNRYIKYNDMYARIVNYTTVTNIIEVENSFGVDILAGETADIIVLENIKINYTEEIPIKSQIAFGNNYSLLVIAYIKTNMDYNKDKIRNIIEDIKDLIISNRYLIPIYDMDEGSPTYGQKICDGLVKENINFTDISNLSTKDDSNGFAEYRCTFEIRYKIKY